MLLPPACIPLTLLQGLSLSLHIHHRLPEMVCDNFIACYPEGTRWCPPPSPGRLIPEIMICHSFSLQAFGVFRQQFVLNAERIFEFLFRPEIQFCLAPVVQGLA